MNIIKKTMLLGVALIPGFMKADTLNDLNVAGDVMRFGRDIMGELGKVDAIKNHDAFIQVNKFLIEPAYSLGGLLKDLPTIQQQLAKTLAEMKSMPTVARCSTKSTSQLQEVDAQGKPMATKKACEPLGCTSTYACLRVGVTNLKNLLLTLNNVFLSSQSTIMRDGQGVVPIILDISQQTGVKTIIKNDVSDNLLKVANLLDELLKIIPTS